MAMQTKTMEISMISFIPHRKPIGKFPLALHPKPLTIVAGACLVQTPIISGLLQYFITSVIITFLFPSIYSPAPYKSFSA